eukprot:CAMPEP_0114345746 /NCGR_PEP_ID=MMETSP0101-20121206/12501_1 /TAXON_ID=38822 ORGANISM="Pteridomonas danica, Strain PT" /NCGR_SAMPLE_ID=MMETSP0101 /ASSEMBLY_ACC=CAM_ASM_000211 /LENGTH=199 /DNA_ID=CAMNT_0001481949 /DNA_START=106 /DNA_END=702 /DNA_ORIENTATION=+
MNLQDINDVNDTKNQNICAICLNSIGKEPCCLPCEHTFHAHCITSLRSYQGLSQVCPLCRTDLPPGPKEAYMRAQFLLAKLNFQLSSNIPETQVKIDEIFSLTQGSAEEGFVMAQHALGVMLFDNEAGRNQDIVKAREWLVRAASQGYAPSQVWLGGIFRNGDGVDKNEREAFKWYRKAAKQGNGNAQFSLGAMLEIGR